MRWTQADVDAANMRKIRALDRARLRQTMAPVVKPSKYGNTKTGSYASRREAKRAAELKLLEQSGLIANLREQVKFVLIPKQEGERACTYVADFTYTDNRLIGLFVVEDVKGYRNPVYRLKRKLMLHVHGIRVRET